MNAMALYDRTTLECSKLVTQRYSTSFSLGIKALDKKYHSPIYGIYGFVRFADEIVDTFFDHDQRNMLFTFKEDTIRAIEQKISLNPVLHAFQLVVHEYKIELDLIEAFLDSMAMDLDKQVYHNENYKEYIYGSAEVVGLMCLKVFCKGNPEQYDELKAAACKLGSAFQKVNFLRDMKSDYEERGRVYFPGLEYAKFNATAKALIEKDIEEDFKAALVGIRNLPEGAKTGVYLAYKYYRSLFKKLCQSSPEAIAASRIRIPNARKLSLLLTTYFGAKLGLE
jgi:15-cis-phytoene synthase